MESYTLHAVDYLLKPVSFERFYDGAKRALDISKSNDSDNKEDSTFFLRHEGAFKRIDPEQIAYVSALQNYTRIHDTDDSQLIVRYTLKGIVDLLDPEQFIMIHKSYVVNMKHVDSISGSNLTITGKGQLPIGRKYKEEVVKRLLNR